MVGRRRGAEILAGASDQSQSAARLRLAGDNLGLRCGFWMQKLRKFGGRQRAGIVKCGQSILIQRRVSCYRKFNRECWLFCLDCYGPTRSPPKENSHELLALAQSSLRYPKVANLAAIQVHFSYEVLAEKTR